MSCQDLRRDAQASQTPTVASPLKQESNKKVEYAEYVPYDYLVQPMDNDIEGKLLYRDCRAAQNEARYVMSST
jgi:hypothetical protein